MGVSPFLLCVHRAELEPHIGEVSTASVACGVMGYGGNKGAAAISFSLFRRRVVLVSSHFAAHQVGGSSPRMTAVLMP
jgi:phosphatidylinositol-bisphosphatase